MLTAAAFIDDLLGKTIATFLVEGAKVSELEGTVVSTTRAATFLVRVEMQNDPRHFPPIGSFVKASHHSQVRDDML